jgi:hypothetical protein
MTLLIVLVALAIVGIIRASPNSALGQVLSVYLAEKPVKLVSKIERHQLIWIGILVLMALSSFKIAAVIGPDFLIAYTSIDLSLYLDAVFVATAVSAASRLRVAARSVQSSVRWMRRQKWPSRGRLSRPRAKAGRRTPKRPDNDEDGTPCVMLGA